MQVREWIQNGALALALGAFALGVGAGTYLMPFFRHEVVQADLREFGNTYHYINPLLACGVDQDLGDEQAKALKNEMQKRIDAHTNAGDITDASVYFRDLNSGPWVGINYNEQFAPGSLLKVPLAMSIYKKAENDPQVLEKKLAYTGTEVDDPQFFTPKPLAAGEHTVEEHLRHMILQSDNSAANVLASSVGVADFQATYARLGITQPSAEGTDYTTTTNTYASFFRILYNATYLDDASSEHLLQLLSESTFTEGLVAGVPASVPVAHKFGERSFMDSNVLQLHDCGIVYAPNHPYLICVMTKGASYPALAKTIADLSRVAYNYVNSGK